MPLKERAAADSPPSETMRAGLDARAAAIVMRVSGAVQRGLAQQRWLTLHPTPGWGAAASMAACQAATTLLVWSNLCVRRR